MKRRLMVLLAVLSLVGLAALPAVGKGHSTNFRAHLSGGNEVPAVDTNAQGQATFKFSNEVDSLHYRLVVANIDDVVAAHVHCAPAGVNGPVGVTLFTGDPVSQNGVLAQATVETPDIANACGWEDLADVRQAMLDGDAYVNVHTTQNPGGEVRGQIR
jgi:hypothetical protein